MEYVIDNEESVQNNSNQPQNETTKCGCGSGRNYDECCGKDNIKKGFESNESEETFKVKRFHDPNTKQIHRFIPLFKIDDWDRVIGICLDSCKVKKSWRRSSGKHVPNILRGQIIECSHDSGEKYKNETVFRLLRVFDSPLGVIGHTKLSHNELNIGGDNYESHFDKIHNIWKSDFLKYRTFTEQLK